MNVSRETLKKKKPKGKLVVNRFSKILAPGKKRTTRIV
jgi:hypothetical protein|tara:strand:- start:467 stop:580 length:114 start_codon:yes stop_codon:yes gene_type:complete